MSDNKDCKKCKYPMSKRCWHPHGSKSKGQRMLHCKNCERIDYLEGDEE